MLPSELVTEVRPAEDTPRQVARTFRELLGSGVAMRPQGRARRDPDLLLRGGYGPRYRVELFDVTFYLSEMRQNDDLRFFVAYLHLHRDPAHRRAVHPRIFYKDSSLVWRTATHLVRTADENWIGKGDVKWVVEDGEEILYSAEETTNLPLELQLSMDLVSRRAARVHEDERALALVLRNAPRNRVEPYADFAAPRRKAMAKPCNRVNGGRPVAWFVRPGDPTSLRFAPGFAPDFRRIVETTDERSSLYGGPIRKLRILSRNGRIQYQFIAGPRHVWIIPPQTLTRELTTYGVRSIDVLADEDLFVPGFEYHFVDELEDPPRLHSQIPTGYAGEPNAVDPSRADASAWLEALPVIRRFRARVPLPF